jgi:poly(3-hydroxybutyrate) depolymerase
VYIPNKCREDTIRCPLHIVLHGCHQYANNINDTFALHTGYNEIAESNNFIIVYPQTKSTILINPNGCWDWWGYTGPEIINYKNCTVFIVYGRKV